MPSREAKSPASATTEFYVRGIHLSIRFDTLHYPVDVTELAAVLPEHGFVVSQRELLNAPMGGRLTGSGALALREDVELRFNSERNVLAIQGRDIPNVLAAFKDMENILLSRFGIDSVTLAQFYELQLDTRVESANDPLQTISSAGAGMEFMKVASRELGQPMALFSVRLTGEGQNPNDLDWTEVRLEPSIPDSNRFVFSAIVRNREREKVIEFLESSAGLAERLINALGSYAL